MPPAVWCSFPADTVYGLACDPEDEAAVRRLYELKGRPADQPAAVMFFDTEQALRALSELGARTLAAARRLLPGAVTALLPNPAGRFALAGGGESLGLRVPAMPGPGRPVLQSSANASGEADARRLADDAHAASRRRRSRDRRGELPGTPSTVVDLTAYEAGGAWRIVRQGAVAADAVASGRLGTR